VQIIGIAAHKREMLNCQQLIGTVSAIYERDTADMATY
jgi:hypothetical protein